MGFEGLRAMVLSGSQLEPTVLRPGSAVLGGSHPGPVSPVKHISNSAALHILFVELSPLANLPPLFKLPKTGTWEGRVRANFQCACLHVRVSFFEGSLVGWSLTGKSNRQCAGFGGRLFCGQKNPQPSGIPARGLGDSGARGLSRPGPGFTSGFPTSQWFDVCYCSQAEKGGPAVAII